MLRDVIEFLICPHCGGDLTLAGISVRCPNDHAFDVARHGYVSLLPERSHTGEPLWPGPTAQPGNPAHPL